ncbi:hypothetical protein AAG570_011443 [Ranatra chinensis]|uniref:Uncharacterized protein n=1 Tax=Ranatra chinensis TaxID=642074 RepID=A0ABD0YKN8_9HEMI
MSQDLDDLENYVRNHSEARVGRIEEFGKVLVEDHVMAESVKSDMKYVAARWDHLSVQRLVEEFEKQANTLKEMEGEVKRYETDGKFEAASRLKEQMVLLKNRFMEVMEKFEDWRSANNVEPRLCRALRELRGVEEACCLLELASEEPEAIQGQLNHCMRFYQMLSDIKTEVENVIKSGRKMVEDKAVSDPEQYTFRLDTLKHLYNRLGEEITAAKGSLETALEIAQNLNANMTSVVNWSQAVNNELDQVEATPQDHRDVKLELAFVLVSGIIAA